MSEEILHPNNNVGVPYMWPISYREGNRSALRSTTRTDLEYRGYQVCVLVNEVLANHKFKKIRFIDADFFYHHLLRENSKTSTYYTHFTRVRAAIKIDKKWKDVFFVLEQGDNWFPAISAHDIPEKIIKSKYGYTENRPHYGNIRLKMHVMDCKYEEIPLLPIGDLSYHSSSFGHYKIFLPEDADFKYRDGVLIFDEYIWATTWKDIENKIVDAYMKLRDRIIKTRTEQIKREREAAEMLLKKAVLDEKFLNEHLLSGNW